MRTHLDMRLCAACRLRPPQHLRVPCAAPLRLRASSCAMHPPCVLVEQLEPPGAPVHRTWRSAGRAGRGTQGAYCASAHQCSPSWGASVYDTGLALAERLGRTHGAAPGPSAVVGGSAEGAPGPICPRISAPAAVRSRQTQLHAQTCQKAVVFMSRSFGNQCTAERMVPTRAVAGPRATHLATPCPHSVQLFEGFRFYYSQVPSCVCGC